jgi:lactoylglutathione lyase
MKQNVLKLTALTLLINLGFRNNQDQQPQMKHYQKIENPMKVNASTPNLMVENMSQTINYYTQLLGFELIHAAPKQGPLQWAYVKKGKAEFMFQAKESLKAEFEELEAYDQGGALTFFIQVEDTKAWYDELKGKVNILKPYGVTAYNGANEFVIMDLNGFILHFSDIRFD